MSNSGDLRVSPRGQMSLPASVRHRWGIEEGGVIAFLDLGDSIVLVPGGMDAIRADVYGAITDEIWADARTGFGDRDLADE